MRFSIRATGTAIALVAASFVGVTQGLAAQTSGDHAREAAARLAGGSFVVLVPQYLPDGTRLLRTNSLTVDGYSSVDLHYALPDGSRLHVWETDQPDAMLGFKAESLARGTPLAGSRAGWRLSDGMDGRVRVIHGRVNGIVVMIDAKIDSLGAAELLRIADSIR